MALAALVTWVLTAGGGFLLLSTWLGRDGMRQRERGRIRPPLIFGHFLLAAAGLVLWIVYVATDSDALAWIAFGMLAAVAAPGEPAEPAEQHFPVAIVALHGVAAFVTLVLVLLAALEVGD